MSDSVSVVIGCEAAAWLAGLPVVPDAGGEGEDALADACPDAGEGAAAVVFEGELAFGGVDDRFDPLTDAAEGAVAGLLVAAGGGGGRGGGGGGRLPPTAPPPTPVAQSPIRSPQGAPRLP